jgi:NADH pyrophosphatase NudC (nudix superfamily)
MLSKFIGTYSGELITLNELEVEQVRFFTRGEYDALVSSMERIGQTSRDYIARYWNGEFDHLLRSVGA